MMPQSSAVLNGSKSKIYDAKYFDRNLEQLEKNIAMPVKTE